MNNEQVIVAENVGKKFRLRSGGNRTLKSAVLDTITLRGRKKHDFWALKNVDFSVKKGETLGIIGVNGAGKSTLLSLLAGTKITSEGRISTKGTISSLLELGAGFHPDLTGRENIFLCGAIMGLSRKQMKERFNAIVDFAELREFIDQPVKHYSSGMYVRLGFAVAVEVDPDILIIDEVLAVGDVAFQRKCLDRIDDFRKKSKTMLIVSHDLATIQTVSDRILLLDHGTVTGIGEPGAIVSRYQTAARDDKTKGLEKEWGTGEAKITNVELTNDSGVITDNYHWGRSLTAKIHYNTTKRIEQPVIGFAIADSKGRFIYGNNTQIEKFSIHHIEGKGEILLHIDKLLMAAGSYLFSFSIHSSDHRINYHRLDNCFPITVESETGFEGTYMPCHWSTEHK